MKRWGIYFGGQVIATIAHFKFALDLYDEVVKIAEVLEKSTYFVDMSTGEVLDSVEGDKVNADNESLVELVLTTAFKKLVK